MLCHLKYYLQSKTKEKDISLLFFLLIIKLLIRDQSTIMLFTLDRFKEKLISNVIYKQFSIMVPCIESELSEFDRFGV